MYREDTAEKKEKDFQFWRSSFTKNPTKSGMPCLCSLLSNRSYLIDLFSAASCHLITLIEKMGVVLIKLSDDSSCVCGADINLSLFPL